MTIPLHTKAIRLENIASRLEDIAKNTGALDVIRRRQFLGTRRLRDEGGRAEREHHRWMRGKLSHRTRRTVMVRKFRMTVHAPNEGIFHVPVTSFTPVGGRYECRPLY